MYTAAADGNSLRLLNRDDLVIEGVDAEDVYMNSPDVSSDGGRIVYTTGIPTKGWRYEGAGDWM